MDNRLQNKGFIILILLLAGSCWATLGDIEVINDLYVASDANIIDDLFIGDDATIIGILQAEHLYTTDDLQVDDDATIDGLGTLGSLIVGTSVLVVGKTGYTDKVGIGTDTPDYILELLGDAYFQGPAGDGGAAPTAFEVTGGTGTHAYAGGPSYIRGGLGGDAESEETGGAGGAVGLYGGDGGAGSGEEVSGGGGNIVLAPGSKGATGGGGLGADGQVDIQGDIDLNTNTLIVPSGGKIAVTGELGFDFAADDWRFVERTGQTLGIQNTTSGRSCAIEFFADDGDGTDYVGFNFWGYGTIGQTSNRELFFVRYHPDGADTFCEISSVAGGEGTTVRPIHIYTGANTEQLVLLATGNNTMSGNLDIGGDLAVTGRTGLGVAVDSKYRLNVYDSGTQTVDRYGIYSNVKVTGAAPVSKSLVGSYSLAQAEHTSVTMQDVIGAMGLGEQKSSDAIVANLYGGKMTASSSELGTTTNAYGLYAGITRPSEHCGPMTNAYGLYSIIDGGAAACTLMSNAYGLYIAAPINTGFITTYYSIYSVSGDNYFGGDIETAGTLTADIVTDGVASMDDGSLTDVKLGSLTDNGFVKTSGGDGTLSVDTDTYLADITGESIDDLSDVNDTDKADGRILKYDSASGKMEYVDDEAGGAALDDITDVTISSVAAGELLAYAAGGDWINRTLTEAGILAIDGSNANATLNISHQDFSTDGTVTTGPLSVGGSISTNLVPNIGAGRELGSSSYRWDLYGRNVYADVIKPTSSLRDLSIYTASFTDQLVLKRETGNIEMGYDLTVAGTLQVDGNITTSGTVDGVDVAALETDVDGFPDALKNVTSSAAELNYLDGSTPGTAVASKALVVDASKDIDLDTGDLTATILTDGTLSISSGAITSAVAGTFSGTATFKIAAVDSEHKDNADYVCDGTADNVQVQAAMDALPSLGGKIVLLEGNYVFAAMVSRAIDDITIEGCGKNTSITYDDSTSLFDVGRRAGWSFRDLATDGGGINLGFDEQADVSNCWRAGEKIDNRVVGGVEHVATLASDGNDGTHDVAVQGDYAYAACYRNDAFYVIDISDPENPSITATLTDGSGRLDGAHDVIVDGDYAYVTVINRNSIVSIDISDPENPSIADELIDATKLAAVHALAKQGDYIYAGGLGGDYFCVIDAGDPTDMSVVGNVSDATYLHYPRGVYPKGDYVYVVTKGGGYLTVIDVSTKASPAITGTPLQIVTDPTNNDCANLRVRGNYAYCTAQAHNELVVVDISNPSSMSVVKRVAINEANYVTLAGNYAFVSGTGAVSMANDRKVYVVDISNPVIASVIYTFYHPDFQFASGLAVYKDYIIGSPRDRVDVALVVFKIPPHPAKEQRRFTKVESRALDAASGDVTYSGYGFRPTIILIDAMWLGPHDIYCRGVAEVYDATEYSKCIYTSSDRKGWADWWNCIVLREASDKIQVAILKEFTEDGFILTWTKTGTPTSATARLFITAIKEK